MTLARTRLAIGIAILAILAGGCGRAPVVTPLRGTTMATTWSVQIADPVADRDALRTAVQASLDRIERLMSTYMPASEVSRFNASPSTDWMPVDRHTCDVVRLALDVSEQSGGAFDITVAPLVNLWGFGPDGTITDRPDRERIDAVLERTGYRRLETDCTRPAIRKAHPALEIDLSGIAKGYAADVVAMRLEQESMVNYLVEIGGEMRLKGSKPDGASWRIGIEAPDRDQRAVFDALALTDAGVATSGDYRNYLEFDGRYYSHTIDPRTGTPVEHLTAAVTVIAENAAFADAMATALLVLGSDDGLALTERENIAALFLNRTEAGVESIVSTGFAEQRRMNDAREQR
jgi:thiamine biosynthesis lipoprotein